MNYETNFPLARHNQYKIFLGIRDKRISFNLKTSWRIFDDEIMHKSKKR